MVSIKDKDSEVDRRTREGIHRRPEQKPMLSTEEWLGRYIFTDIHEILFGGIHQELYEWLARLADTQFDIISRPPVVWTSVLIKKVKRVDNAVSGSVDH